MTDTTRLVEQARELCQETTHGRTRMVLVALADAVEQLERRNTIAEDVSRLQFDALNELRARVAELEADCDRYREGIEAVADAMNRENIYTTYVWEDDLRDLLPTDTEGT